MSSNEFAGFRQDSQMSDITPLIRKAEGGDPQAKEALFSRVYNDLRRLAGVRFSGEALGDTLQPTALVHEVYLRLFGPRVDGNERSVTVFRDRAHFFSAAAEAMKRILVDAARRRQRQKRGGGLRPCRCDPNSLADAEVSDELLALNESLDELARLQPEIAQLVSLRFFAGLTNQEATTVLGISERTGNTYWAYARGWLQAEIQASRQESQGS